VVDGDALLLSLAAYLLRGRALRRRTLVTTVMSNLALDHALAAIGAKVVRTQVGDRYVVERMRRGGFSFGGEQSGHLIFLQHATTGDGTLAGLMVLAMMLEAGRPLSEIVHGFEPFPQAQVAVAVQHKPPLASLDTVQEAIRRAERALGERGRVLVRYSGTEPKARVLVEGPKEALIQREAERIAGALDRAIGA
jgi:phosphoglucosamine mutase